VVRWLLRGLPCAPALLARLTAHGRALPAAVAAHDSERYIDQALSFHRELVAASGNRTFLSVWDSLHWDVRGRIALRNIAERGRGLKPLIGLHRKLLVALRAADADTGTQAIRAVFAYVGTAFSPQRASKKDFTAERQKGGTSPA